MSYPAILIPDHFEVALVRSNSGLTGKTKQIIDLNGGHIQSHHQMRRAGGIAKVNDLGLMSIIGIEKTLLLRGTITQSDDSHKRENSARIDTSLIRSLGANIVGAAPIIEAIRDLPSPYIEQLRPEQQVNIQKIFDKLNVVLNLNAVTAIAGAEMAFAKQIEAAVTDLLNIIGETFPTHALPSQNIFLSVLKTIEPVIIQHNLSIDLQNTISTLENNILNFIESAPALDLISENTISNIPLDIITAIDIPDTQSDINNILLADDNIIAVIFDTELENINTEVASDNEIIPENSVIEDNAVPTDENNIGNDNDIETYSIHFSNISMPLSSDTHSLSQPLSQAISTPIHSDITSSYFKTAESNFISSKPITNVNSSITKTLPSITNVKPSPLLQIFPTIKAISIAAPTVTRLLQTPRAIQRILSHQQSPIRQIFAKPLPITTIPKGTNNIPKPSTQIAQPQIKKTPLTPNNVIGKPVLVPKTPIPSMPKPSQALRNIPVQQQILKRVIDVPRSLDRATVIIKSILKPQSSSPTITVSPRPANNNQPSLTRAQAPNKSLPAPNIDPLHAPKHPIKEAFKVSTHIVKETLVSTASDFYHKIKSNSGVKAVCGISGGICRCAEKFNNAVRGHIDKTTRKILQKNNISETQFVDDAKAQRKTSEIIESLSTTRTKEQSQKEDDLILRTRDKKDNKDVHIHGPWCEPAPPQERTKITAVILPTPQAPDPSQAETGNKTPTARELREMLKNNHN